MKYCIISVIFLLPIVHQTHQEELRLLDLEPQDAKQLIEQQDTSLKYAPKIESNVPAVRYLGNEPHNVAEDIYLANQYHGQDGLGGYLYGYSVPDIAKTEKKQAGGDLRGAYNYIAGNGQEIKVEYWDDGTGFHQIDNVPKNLPEDLPEVKQAKEEFMRIWQEQAERNSHPVEDPYNSEGQYKEGPLSVQGQLHRQQQFTAQFGQNPGQQQPGGYQAAGSQQKPVYQSNLEKTPQTYNPSYQPYQGRDQQNQGVYESKQYSSVAKGPSYGQAQPGQVSGGYGQGSVPTQGQGSVSHTSQSSGYGQGNVGTQSQGSVGYTSQSSGYGQGNVGPQGQGAVGYTSKTSGSVPGYGQSGQISQNQGASTYGQTNPARQGSLGQWGQQAQKGYQAPQGGYQNQYQGQSSQNVNKYAAQPQVPSYGGQRNDYSGQPTENQNKYTPQQGQEDDGEYHEKDEEQQGPPKGFFYKFDYPVGIIVSKQGSAIGPGHGEQRHQSGGGYGQQTGGYGPQSGVQGKPQTY